MKKQKMLSLVLACLCAIITSSCTDSQEINTESNSNNTTNEDSFTVTMTEEGYPVCSEKITVKALIGFQWPNVVLWDSPNEIPFYQEYEEKTNIHVEWETIARADFKQRFNLLIAGDDLPDMFMKTSGLTDSDLIQNGQAGALVDFTPYMEEYAPDLNTYLEDHDLTQYLSIGGGIWGAPYLYDSEGITISKAFFNTKWLEQANLEMPTTVDEMTEVFRAFKPIADANDGVALALFNQDDMFSWFGGAYGLANRGNANTWIDADPTDSTGNTLRFWRTAEKAKDVLKLEKMYYEEGLIKQNIFNTTDYSTQINGLMNAGNVGAHDLWTTVIGTQNVDNFLTTDVPPAGPDGNTLWTNVTGKIGSKAGLLITKQCEHPEALVGWVNYFYTTQGTMDYFLGEEGVSYILNEDGTTELTPYVTNNPDGLDQAAVQYKYSLAGGGGNPGLATDQTFKGGETYWTSLEGNDKYRPYIPDIVWEKFPLTAEQASQISSVTADMSAVIQEYEAKFVTGVLDIDKDWDEYQNKLDQAGRKIYLQTYQEAYNTLIQK